MHEVVGRMGHKYKDKTSGEFLLHYLESDAAHLEYIGNTEYFSPLNWGGDKDVLNGEAVGQMLQPMLIVSKTPPRSILGCVLPLFALSSPRSLSLIGTHFIFLHPKFANVLGVMQTYLSASKPLLLSCGLPEETVTEWMKNVEHELRTTRLYLTWDYNWSIRRSDN